MPTYTDTNVSNMIFNVLDADTYDSLSANNQLNNNELYLITDDDERYKTRQSAVSSPSASGNASAFIDTITQNENGVITVTKKNLNTSGTWSGKATTAGTADKVANKLILKLGSTSASTENTNLYTFDGSAAKTLSILGGSGITLTTAANQVTVAHSNSITAGTASGEATKTLTWGGTFALPSVTYDAQGHITSKTTTTMTMPSNPNTDYRVRQTDTTTDSNYRVLFSNSANDTQEDNISRKNANLIFNPSTGLLSTKNISLTGDITVTGDAYLNNQTYAEDITTNTLLVNGNTSFVAIPTAPTAVAGTSNTQLATTEFVSTASTSGNAATATGFASAKTIALTGNVTGSATGGNGSNGWSIATTIPSSTVTNAMLAGSIENGKLAHSSVTIAGTAVSLGGSVSADTLRTSLGLSNAMHFIGTTTTAVSDGLTTRAVTISGSSYNANAGDVVLYSGSEYVWTGSAWEILGPDSSYKVRQTAITDSTGTSESTAATRFIYSISQDANGVVSVKTRPIPEYTNFTLEPAASDALGGIKIGYNASGKNYAVQLDSDNKAYVNVPWSNTWNALSTSSAGYVTQAPNDTHKFLRGDATWADITAAKTTTLAWNTTSTIATIGGYDIKVTLPANPNTNTDTLVKQTAKTDNVNYKLLATASASPTSGNAAEAVYDTDITLNPSTNTITATNFAGTATSANKVNHDLNLANDRKYNGSEDVTLLTNDLTPAISKVYESTDYYASSANSYETATWYFMSVKPDEWYKPWTVRFKVHSYCPSYANVNSTTYCTLSGRAGSMIQANWNERNDAAHYYICTYPLKSAGFDGGYGHAIGISILYGNNYTSSAYYRTFEVDYYNCDGCTIEMLDTPVKWASWTGTGTTNYNSISALNAVDRGLQESGDANNYEILQMSSNYLTNGSNIRLGPYSLFGLDRQGYVQSFSLYNDGYTSSTTSINTVRVYNTGGIDWTKGIYYSSSGTNFAVDASVNISVRLAQSAADFRYTDNCVATTATSTLGLVARKMVYIRGVIKEDGLFYLAPLSVTYNSNTYQRVWTQDIPTSVETDGTYQYVYWEIGYPYYNSSYAGGYQINLQVENKVYWYNNGRFEEYQAKSRGISNITRSGTTYTVTRDDGTTFTFSQQDNNTTYTFNTTAQTNKIQYKETGASSWTDIPISVSITNNITGSGTSGYLAKFNGANSITNGPQITSGGTGFLKQDGTWATPAGTYSLPTASTSTKGGIKIGTGLTMNGEVMNHSNSVTAKTAYGSTATTASANGGTIIVTDIKYDAQGHITSSTDRTITLSQTTYTLSGLGGVGSVSASGTAPLTLSASKSGTTATITGSIQAASTTASGVVQLTDSTSSTSTTTAATPNSVKSAYDLANNHKYWANVEATSAAAYNKAPEMATIKLNGNTSASAASTKNVVLVYDSTLEVLNFVFA